MGILDLCASNKHASSNPSFCTSFFNFLWLERLTPLFTVQVLRLISQFVIMVTVFQVGREGTNSAAVLTRHINKFITMEPKDAVTMHMSSVLRLKYVVPMEPSKR